MGIFESRKEFEELLGAFATAEGSLRSIREHFNNLLVDGPVAEQIQGNIASSDTALRFVGDVIENEISLLEESRADFVRMVPAFNALIKQLRGIADKGETLRSFVSTAGLDNCTVDEQGVLRDTQGRSLDLSVFSGEMKAIVSNSIPHVSALRLFGSKPKKWAFDFSRYNEISRELRELLTQSKQSAQDADEAREAAAAAQGAVQEHATAIRVLESEARKSNENGAQALADLRAKAEAARAVAADAEVLKQQVADYEAKFRAFDADLETRIEKIDAAVEKNQAAIERAEEREKAIDDLVGRAEEMLKGATNSGLTYAFNKAAEKYQADSDKALRSFYIAIGFLFVCTLPLASYVLDLPWLRIEGSDGESVSFSGVLARLVLLIPGVWVSTLAASRYFSLFQLHREYAFKAAIAMSVDGFKLQAPDYASEIAGTAFIELAQKPEYRPKTEPGSRAPNPILQKLFEAIQSRFKSSEAVED